MAQRILRFLTLLFSLIAACWPLNACGVKNPVVYIGGTSIKGLQSRTGNQYVCKFLGIRYAQAPKGPLRFKPPILEELPLFVDASRYGARCAQFPLRNTGMSEDCLFLNIYTPQTYPEPSLPVLVWIHGGGFITGAGDVFEGDVVAAEGQVVVVTMNYRLGVLGFLSTGDNSSEGNYGLLDQRMALKWVHRYIEHFGGDARRVTLAGVSAGAASASIHSLSPLSRGLFRHVIQMSGSASSPWATMTTANALHAARALGSRLDCPSRPHATSTTQALVKCIRNQRLERLVRASTVLFPHKVALSLVDVMWGL